MWTKTVVPVCVVTVGTQDSVSWWETISTEPAVKLYPVSDLFPFFVTAAVNVVDLKEHRLGFFAAGATVTTVGFKYRISEFVAVLLAYISTMLASRTVFDFSFLTGCADATLTQIVSTICKTLLLFLLVRCTTHAASLTQKWLVRRFQY